MPVIKSRAKKETNDAVINEMVALAKNYDTIVHFSDLK